MLQGTPASNLHARALLSSALATLALTSVHHVYGAVRYQTPWRYHAVIISLGVGVALLAAFFLYRRDLGTPGSRLAGWMLAGLSLVFPVLLFGVYEGAYNHVLKVALFLAGAPMTLLLHLFPPPTYELPNDVLFEVTGVLQVLPAALAARALLRFLTQRRVLLPVR